MDEKPRTGLEKLGYWARKLDSYGVEARGIERVLPEERRKQNWLALSLIWAAGGMNLSSFSVGVYGVLFYNLTLGQTLGIVWGVSALGSLCSAYMATFGKRNGLRALVNSRFAFGWYGSMVMAFLNGFTEVAYGTMDCILGGQTLETVSQGRLPLPVGIVLISAISWVIATGGYKFIHWYSRIALIFPMLSFLAMYGVVGPKFTTVDTTYEEPAEDRSGQMLSYIAIIYGAYAGWIPVSGDYYIYFPESTPDWKVLAMSFFGIWVLPSFAVSCGAGFASALLTDPDWLARYDDSVPNLYVSSLPLPIGSARFFFVFLLGWSLISNNIFNLYSIGLSVPLLGDWAIRIPRFVWTLLGSILITVLSVVGRNSFTAVLSNTMALIGYWSIIYFAIFVIEFVFIRPKFGLDLTAWNDRSRLPPGYAAGLAFCFGIMGAVLGMCQTWYTGKIGALIGSLGGDLGTELGLAFTAVVYPVFRYIEFKKFGR
ncbi:hypothetical protein GQ53DRAFT_632575 [Thozetella sp. PMI_491]|nr:hypothetical protein GQ53DRAFT_632575 [Thozetella sp. PMI_491]